MSASDSNEDDPWNRRKLTKAQFASALRKEGVVDELRRQGLWANDSASSFTVDDLWRFYCRHASTQFDSAVGQLRDDKARLAAAARLMRDAARELRWSLKITADLWPLADGPGAERAAEFLCLPPTRRRELAKKVESGFPLDYAEILDRLAAAQKPRGRGRPANDSRSRFLLEWSLMAKERAGTELDDVGESLFKIVFGIELSDYARSRRARQKRR